MTPYNRFLKALTMDAEREIDSNLTENGWIVDSNRPLNFSPPRYSLSAIIEMQIAFHEALKSNDPLPQEMKTFLSIGFEYLCAGLEHELFQPYKRKGRPTSPYGEALKEYALNYYKASLINKEIDINPIDTIAKSYNVATKTVKNWISKLEEKSPLPSQNFYYTDIKTLKSNLKVFGKKYQQAFNKS